MNKNLTIAGIAVLVIVVVGTYFVFGNRTTNNSTQSQTETQMVEDKMEDKMTEGEEAMGEDAMMEEEGDKMMEEEGAMSKTEVEIANFAFSPASINIKAGESVTWKNTDSVAHTATADDGSFDTGLINQGQSKTIKFEKAGTYTYHCTPHPNMKGTVVVE